MTIDTLFGAEKVTSKPRTIKFKQIKAVYETLTVKDLNSRNFITMIEIYNP